MGQGNSLKFENLRSLAFGSISGTYALVGSVLNNPSKVFLVQNLTDVTITFSTDGTNDKFILPVGAALVIDVTANRDPELPLAMDAGTGIWAKGSPSSGAVYVTSAYAWSIS